MNSFDPFITPECHIDQKDETLFESEPCLTKKTVSQFLSEIWSYSFSGHNNQMLDHPQTYMIVEKQSENFSMKEISHSHSNSENNKKSNSKNSIFHNFQKHLVITLRQILTLKGLSLQIGVQREAAAKIFDYFKKSQKTSRLFLQQIFGLIETKDLQNPSDYIKKIRKGELKGIIENYEDETIVSAHKILKKLTQSELDECDLWESLAHRKIEKKREFIEYINMFKKELVQGKQRKKTYKLLAKKFNNR